MRFRRRILSLAMVLALGASPAHAAGSDALNRADYNKALLSLTPQSDYTRFMDNLNDAQQTFSLLGEYENSEALTLYAQGMIKLFSSQFAGAEFDFSALSGNEDAARDLALWGLPSAGDLLCYAKAANIELTGGALSEAAALYEQIPHLFDAQARLASLRQRMADTGLPTSIAVTPNTLDNVQVGDQVQLSVQYAPASASTDGLAWSSANESVAVVDQNGLVTALSEGIAVINFGNGSNLQGSCIVFVSAPTATTLTLPQKSLEMQVGETAQMDALVQPEEATVTWMSNNPSVVTVTSTGALVAQNVGSAVITVSSGGLVDACTVNVTPAVIEVSSIALNYTSVTMDEGDGLNLIANVMPMNASDPTITWTSTDAYVADVAGGYVTATGEGTATVTATASNGVSASCLIRVERSYLSINQYGSKYSIDRSSAYVNKNTSRSVEARCAVDNNLDSAWNTDGKGAGEWISLTCTDGNKYRVSALGFYNGYIRKSSTWKQNSRIQELDVFCDNQYIATLTLADTKEYQSFRLPEPMIGSHFKFVIRSVYRGTDFSDCCLTELYLLD